ncbi:MAG: SpoIIE family protein phosphatase [Selenomonadaceae bacterium]|nr:SpoIIE family protein phosphatase [Selenomonadaceae bacterium]
MEKIRALFTYLWSGKGSIYRRILRTALWGSLVTFLAMGMISLCGMFILHRETLNRGEYLSENVGKYLKDAIQKEVSEHICETTRIRAMGVERLLKSCAYNVQLMADKMTDILHNEEVHKPNQLPVANFQKVAIGTPYVYYSPEIVKTGISYDLSREISYASSIDDDMGLLDRKFYGAVLLASERGYLIRIDMVGDEQKLAPLCSEPLRSTYDYMSRKWYLDTKEAQKLIYTEPYITSYGGYCISVCAPYYDENGFAGVALADLNTDYILTRMNSNEDIETDFSFIVGQKGEIIISPLKEGPFSATEGPRDLLSSENSDLATVAQRIMKGEVGLAEVVVEGREYYLAYAPLPDVGWSICTVKNKAEAMASVHRIEEYTQGIISDYSAGLQKFFLLMAMLSALLFVCILAAILKANVRLAKSFAAPINLLTERAREIARGNFEKKFSIDTGDELETLAESFNTMMDELAAYTEHLSKMSAQKERIETELSVATRIQAGMLPRVGKPFVRKEFDLAAIMQPAKEVGGDFYDFYFIDERHLAITVADVSDKGVPAALFMVIAKTLLKESLLFAGADKLGQVFEETNNALVNVNEENMFVTVFTGILDIKTGEFVYANAGHNPPVLKAGGKCRFLNKADCPILGMVEGLAFPTRTLKLSPGDCLILYTDGVTEARNEENGFFEEKRLLKATEALGKNAKADINEMLSILTKYAGKAEQSDDITMLELIYHAFENERNVQL